MVRVRLTAPLGLLTVLEAAGMGLTAAKYEEICQSKRSIAKGRNALISGAKEHGQASPIWLPCDMLKGAFAAGAGWGF